jgi:hypothetical protein
VIKTIFQVGLAVSAIFIGLKIGGDLLGRIRRSSGSAQALNSSAAAANNAANGPVTT